MVNMEQTKKSTKDQISKSFGKSWEIMQSTKEEDTKSKSKDKDKKREENEVTLVNGDKEGQEKQLITECQEKKDNSQKQETEQKEKVEELMVGPVECH